MALCREVATELGARKIVAVNGKTRGFPQRQNVILDHQFPNLLAPGLNPARATGTSQAWHLANDECTSHAWDFLL
ncbi:hypothetical protein MB46_16065 [Arthrobacter alpinus]|nr:hypothetical protein MB46_16065 [Arthrobacter alpinus]